jgi:hypothetical protein
MEMDPRAEIKMVEVDDTVDYLKQANAEIRKQHELLLAYKEDRADKTKGLAKKEKESDICLIYTSKRTSESID